MQANHRNWNAKALQNINKRGNDVKKSNVIEIEDFLDIDWQPIARGFNSRGAKFDRMDLRVVVNVKEAKDGKITRVMSLRIGEGLCAEMGWEDRDTILVSYDKDDVHNMMVIKASNGYALGLEGGEAARKSLHITKVYRATMKADHLICGNLRSAVQPYKLDKKNKRLFFRLVME